jgi:uncharacterized protein YecT (DUF1311 family)
MFVTAAALLLATSAMPAWAQDSAATCKNPVTQMDLNRCSAQDYDAADGELNLQYRETWAALAEWDAALPEAQRGAEKALLAGQRAWIAYRDAQCETSGFQARGGSMEPMLVSGCAADLTRRRTGELKDLATAME